MKPTFVQLPHDMRKRAEEYANKRTSGQDVTPGPENRWFAAYEGYLAGAADAQREILAKVVTLEEWCRACQVEKENASENEKPDFIRHSILHDLEKEIRRISLPPTLEGER